MKFIGILTTACVTAAVAAAALVGVRSIPDIRRYLQMRSM